MTRTTVGWWKRTTERQEADRLIRQHRTYIFRLALAITTHHDAAEDVTQEACCRIANAFDRATAAANPKGWVRKVTVRCALDHLAARTTVPLEGEVPAQSVNADRKIAVAQTLSALKPEHRTILALAYFEGLGYEEIAAVLDLPIGSVASRLHHAKQRFREKWESE